MLARGPDKVYYLVLKTLSVAGWLASAESSDHADLYTNRSHMPAGDCDVFV